MGLDFGTTNSAVAFVEGAGPPHLATFPSASGLRQTFPSALYFEPKSPSIAGSAAIERYLPEPGFRVLASCTNGDEALRAVRRHHPDVLVLDLEIPGNAMKILQELAADRVTTRVVLLAARLYEHEMLEATRLGVKGILLKSMARHLLIHCVRKVHRGSTWLEKACMARAVEQLLRHEAGYRDVVASGPPDPASGPRPRSDAREPRRCGPINVAGTGVRLVRQLPRQRRRLAPTSIAIKRSVCARPPNGRGNVFHDRLLS